MHEVRILAAVTNLPYMGGINTRLLVIVVDAANLR